jgi:hypothetical protein
MNDSQHHNALPFAEYHMLSVTYELFILNVIRLSVIMLNVIMLRVMAPLLSAELFLPYWDRLFGLLFSRRDT